MGRMLCTIASDNLIHSIVTTQWEVNFEDMIAWLHERKNSLDFVALLIDGGALLHISDQRVLDDLTTAMEEVFDL